MPILTIPTDQQTKKLYEEYQAQFDGLTKLIGELETYFVIEEKKSKKEPIDASDSLFYAIHNTGVYATPHVKCVANHAIGLLQTIHSNIINYHMTKSLITLNKEQESALIDSSDTTYKTVNAKASTRHIIRDSLTKLGEKKSLTDFTTLFHQALSADESNNTSKAATAKYYSEQF